MNMEVTLIAAMTADGFIADANGNGDFSSQEDKSHLREFLHSNSVDGFILGRKTALEFAARLTHKPLFVFTRNTNLTDTNNFMYCRDIAELRIKIERLRHPHRPTHLALLGGGEIYSHFLANRLVDQMIITVETNLTFGSGTPLNLAKYLPEFKQSQVLQLSNTTKVFVYNKPAT